MAIEYINREQKWTRLSTDTEPTLRPDGSAFQPGDKMLIIDTGAVRIYGSSGWHNYQAANPASLDFSTLPTTDPGVAGKAWIDPTGHIAVSAG